MTYIIEGIVSELSFDEKFFRVKGCEGFSLMRNSQKYNLLCSVPMSENEKYGLCVIFPLEAKFPVCDDNKDLLLQAIANGKRVKMQLVCLHLKQKEWQKKYW